jgi:hypothetical protein
MQRIGRLAVFSDIKWTYKKEKGYQLPLEFLFEVGPVLWDEFNADIPF